MMPSEPAPPADSVAADKPGKDVLVLDAGLRSLDHYKRALPRWRYNLRRRILPLIRWETPYLAYMQALIRTPLLDRYFAITANLGTHTFFMISLPIVYWCGFPYLGNALVRILSLGVCFTGFSKDLFSLPRPLSPPLKRITMSGSAALEYGFPSTHSANSIGVTAYILALLHSPANPLCDTTKILLELVAYIYAFSVVFGRLYCGMHGFLDVIVGSAIGFALALSETNFGPAFDKMLVQSVWQVPVLMTVIIIVYVRIHPEPADDCPCFDDCVAFAAVLIGIELGTWHLFNHPTLSLILLSVSTTARLTWLQTILRVVVGVLIIIGWKELMKPLLLQVLPPLFRVFETRWSVLGIYVPRRFFTRSTSYDSIPSSLKMDNLMPCVDEIPRLISSFTPAGGRGRSVSVGPQSVADAYETLAYREHQRRGSGATYSSVTRQFANESSLRVHSESRLGRTVEADEGEVAFEESAVEEDDGFEVAPARGPRHQSPLERYERMMGQGKAVFDDGEEQRDHEHIRVNSRDAKTLRPREELDETEVFSRVVKPRVRYDVEVVTKLVVYAGIGFLSTDLIPIVFEYIGLGVRHFY